MTKEVTIDYIRCPECSYVYEATLEIYDMAKVNNPDLAIIKVQGDAAGSASHPSVASHKQVAEQLIAKIKLEMGW